MPRKPAVAIAFLLLALILPAAALAGNGGIAPPPADTPSGDTIRELYWVVLALCGVVFVLIETVLVLFVIRFRRRRDTPEDAEGPQIHGNTRLEIIWTIIPAVVLAGLAVFTIARTPAVQANASEPGSVSIRVDSHQFYWQYRYPNGALSFDTLYLPAGRKASLELRSADVNHSWWVPELTGKLDAIPGRVNYLNFKPRDTGVFRNGKCAEFCGIQHAVMATTVNVVSNEEYQAWLEENAPGGGSEQLVALGKQEWEAACAKCHGLDGRGDIGPSIRGNGTLLNASGLKRLLLEGQDLETNPSFMPAVGRGWEDRQFDALIAYIKSRPELRKSPAQGGGTDGG